MKKTIELIVIGASAGGIVALKKLFPMLSEAFRIPIMATLHIPEDFNIEFRTIFKGYTDYTVCEVKDKTPIMEKTLYFSPAGYHTLIEKNKTLALTQDEPVHFSRPSIDVLFESAAEIFKSHVCGVLLTGANQDGAKGLQAIHNYKGLTVVEDPSTATASLMPQSALNLIKPDFVGDVTQIANFLNQIEVGGVFDEK